ncbi:hypothetical protein [Spirosoma sp.]|uniref:hypothetical protein n=1 Tax=Spirosoma sp. TaxID=1899569 RepID=UPI003B3A2682
METKRRIVIYKDLNEPYRQFLRDGMNMTPDELFVSFMNMRAKNRLMFGLKKKTDKRLTIHKPSWI